MESGNNILILQRLVIDLSARLSVLEQENALLKLENTELKAENTLLRQRLGMNSENSDKPSSTDGYKKKPSPAFGRGVGKKVGGQLGHEGHSLELVAVADSVEIHHAPCCVVCGESFLVGDKHYIGVKQKRQVWDMPDPKLYVTEHQQGVHICCGQAHLGTFPSEVSARIQYGTNLETLSSLLTTEYRLSYEKASALLSDLYGCSLNVSTIVSANEDLYEALAPVEETIKTAILHSEVAHFDETGMRVEGKLHWFHVACTGLFCYFFVHAKRGLEAINGATSLLPRFTGRAVHDCWASYFSFKNCLHALCGAHLLRELNALVENGSQWAKEMHAFLMERYEQSEKGIQIAPHEDIWRPQYKAICEKADIEEPAPVARKRGKPKNSKGRNLLNRLLTYQEEVLAFALHQNVPFTNNCAEQAIRHVKIKQKISMSFRTLHGAEVYARIQGVINTIKKHKMNLFQTMKDIKCKKSIIFSPTK